MRGPPTPLASPSSFPRPTPPTHFAHTRGWVRPFCIFPIYCTGTPGPPPGPPHSKSLFGLLSDCKKSGGGWDPGPSCQSTAGQEALVFPPGAKFFPHGASASLKTMRHIRGSCQISSTGSHRNLVGCPLLACHPPALFIPLPRPTS